MLLELKAFVTLAEKVRCRHLALPILRQVCIAGGKIRISDLENTLTMPFDDDRQYCIPLEVLKQVLKVNPGEILINLIDDDRAEIMFDLHSVVCPIRPADEYPGLPAGDYREIAVWTKAMLQRLRRQMPFTSADNLKPAMTGIQIRQVEQQVKSCATDGHILEYIDDLDPERECSILTPFIGIIARKTVNLLNQIPVSKVPVAVKENYLRFELSGGMELYSRLIEEPFPDFGDIIASAKNSEVRVEREGLLKALRIAGCFSHPDTHQGVLRIHDRLITVSTKDLDRDIEFETCIPTLERLSDEMRIGFDLALLEQIMAVIPEPEILWRYSSPVTAHLFSGIGNPSIVNLIMPVRIEEEDGKCTD